MWWPEKRPASALGSPAARPAWFRGSAVSRDRSVLPDGAEPAEPLAVPLAPAPGLVGVLG